MTCYSGLGGVGMATSIATPMTCYSGLGGVGMGFLYIPGVVASQAHFTRRRALAVGIAVCGTGVGTLVLPPVVELMVETWGWRSALQALACLCLASTMCGLAMFPAPDTVTSTKEEERLEQTDTPPIECRGWRWPLSFLVGSTLASSPALPLFLMVMVADFLATMSLCIPYAFLPAMAVTQGIDAQDAAFLISAAGISSTVGRVLAGLLCDQRRLHPMTITLLATSPAYWSFVLLASGFGLCTGLWVACETPLIIRTLSFHLLTPAFGLLTAGGGVAALIGPPLAGRMEDISAHGHAGITLVICAAIMAASALAYSAATLVRRKTAARVGYEEIS